jgi:hypothetical protein
MTNPGAPIPLPDDASAQIRTDGAGGVRNAAGGGRPFTPGRSNVRDRPVAIIGGNVRVDNGDDRNQRR